MEMKLIFDHRTYICRPGTIKKQLEFYYENGYAAQVRHLGEPLLYAATETGDVNSFVHIWAYESAADRETRRAAMQADPEWQAYVKMGAERGYLVSQKNKILVSAPFFEAKR